MAASSFATSILSIELGLNSNRDQTCPHPYMVKCGWRLVVVEDHLYPFGSMFKL